MAKSYGGVRNSGMLVRSGGEVIVSGGGVEPISLERDSAPVSPQDQIMDVINELQTNGFSKQQPFSIGEVEPDLKQYASAHGIELGDNNIYFTPKQIQHALRALHTNKGIDISPQDLASFPERRASMALFHDTEKNKFVYFDGRIKYVVHPNYTLKIKGGKKQTTNFITAYRGTIREFDKRNFIKIR